MISHDHSQAGLAHHPPAPHGAHGAHAHTHDKHAGHDPAVVRRVSNLLDLAEYKRRQAPPGVKITRKAFGRDRRYPITNAFRKIGIGGQGQPDQPPDSAAARTAGHRPPDQA